VCHLGDTSLAVRASERGRIFSRFGLGRVYDCGGCHDQAACDACHGYRMPHPEQFVKWQHARSAGFRKKESCWGCHLVTDCGRCHDKWEPSGHGSDWLQLHGRTGPVSPTGGCTCHWSRLPQAGRDEAVNYCGVCH
jgi:hypothetical protein